MEARLDLFLPILKSGGDLGAHLTAAVVENDGLKANLKISDQFIASLKDQNAVAQKEIQRLKNEVKKTQDAFDKQKKSDKKIISGLEQEISTQKKTIKNAHDESNKLKSDLNSKIKKVSELEVTISRLRSDLRNAQK